MTGARRNGKQQSTSSLGAVAWAKTRLLIRMAKKRQRDGWLSGFLTLGEADRAPTEAWDALVSRGRPLFLVVDYAETRRDLLVPVILGMLDLIRAKNPNLRVRMVLLARHSYDWWEALMAEGDGVGAILQGPMTSVDELSALAGKPKDRIDSYWTAARAFSEDLGKPLPEIDPGPLSEEFYERVLILHMSALAAVEGELESFGERDPILDYILRRERWYWERLAKDRDMASTVVRGLGRAMAAFTAGGGARTQQEAVTSLRQLHFFSAMEPPTLEDVARILHDSYSDDRQFIAPLQPDPLGEHLVHREMEKGADELIDLIFAG